MLVAERIDDDFLDVRDVLDVIFDLLGVDVLAVCEDDDVLLAARDDELSALVHRAVVAGGEPAVLGQDLRGRLGLLVIAEHDDVALHADLADALGRDVVKAELDAGQDAADGVPVVEIVAVRGDEGRAFGDAVAVDEVDADRVEEFADLGTDGRAAAHDLAQVAAEVLMDGLEEFLPHVDADLTETVARLDEPTERAGLARFLGGLPDLAVEDLGERGNEVDVIRLVGVEVLQNEAEVLVDADRRVVVQGYEQPRDRLVGVVIGEDGEAGFVDGRDLQAVIDDGDEVVLGEHDALRHARGAGGVDDHLEIVFPADVRVVLVVALVEERMAVRDEVAVGDEAGILAEVVRAAVLLRFQIVVDHAHEELDAGERAVGVPLYDVVVGLGIEENGGVAVVQDVEDVRLGEILVDRDIDAVPGERGEIDGDPAVAVFADLRDVTVDQALFGQCGAEGVHVADEFAVGDVADGGGVDAVAERDLVGGLVPGDLQKLADGMNGGDFVKGIILEFLHGNVLL